jgi:hypothetical protein
MGMFELDSYGLEGDLLAEEGDPAPQEERNLPEVEGDPTERADVNFDRTIVRVGAGVKRGDLEANVGVFSDAPTGSAAAVASAMLQATIASSIGAVVIAWVCKSAGAPTKVTVTAAIAVYCLITIAVLIPVIRAGGSAKDGA